MDNELASTDKLKQSNDKERSVRREARIASLQQITDLIYKGLVRHVQIASELLSFIVSLVSEENSPSLCFTFRIFGRKTS